MNSIVQWDPFHELEDMHRRLTTLFDSGRTHRRGEKGELALAEWEPAVDIHEDEKAYIVRAELPDMKKEDVHVSLENGVLTMSGERKMEKEEKGRKYHRVERSYGSFLRSFALPEDIDPKKVNASYKDGLLTITVAKSEGTKPKHVEVKVD